MEPGKEDAEVKRGRLGSSKVKMAVMILHFLMFSLSILNRETGNFKQNELSMN